MAIDTTSARTRCAILMGALGGAAAAAAAAIGRANPVSADDGDVVHVAHSYSGTGPTVLNVSGSTSRAAFIGTHDTGYGIWGTSIQSSGVEGYSLSKVGVRGWARGNSTGVMGVSAAGITSLPSAPANTGVYGVASQDSTSIGVYGRSASGTGIYGTSPNGNGVYGDSAAGAGIYGLSNAPSVAAAIGRSQGGSTGVQGFSGSGELPHPPPNTGVYGSAPSGRGGQFSGGRAQLRLVPSSATTHPETGAVGDLFLDANKRLWLCKGNALWHQIG